MLLAEEQTLWVNRNLIRIATFAEVMLFALIWRKHSNRFWQSCPFPLEIHQSSVIQRHVEHSSGRGEEHWGLYKEARSLDESLQHSNLACTEEM